jgi:haloalkane dehalogenase
MMTGDQPAATDVTAAIDAHELDAYLVLLRRTDNGRAFLKIMRGFELTRAKRDLYVGLLRSRAFPVQIIWGEADPAPQGHHIR